MWKCGFGQMFNLALLNPFKKIVLVLHRHSLCRIRVMVSSWIFCFYMLTVKLKTISCLTLKPFIIFSLVKLIHTFESFSLTQSCLILRVEVSGEAEIEPADMQVSWGNILYTTLTLPSINTWNFKVDWSLLVWSLL